MRTLWVMDGKDEYFRNKPKPLKDTDLTRVRGVNGANGSENSSKAIRRPNQRGKVGDFVHTLRPRRREADWRYEEDVARPWEELREPDPVVLDTDGYLSYACPGKPTGTSYARDWRS